MTHYTYKVVGDQVHTYVTALINKEPLEDFMLSSRAEELSEIPKGIAESFIESLILDHYPYIAPEYRLAIKTRAMDTVAGFDGRPAEMAVKAVEHAYREALIKGMP